ncbi:MAG: HAD-IIIC family phosphatase [Alphaproteobacteria bacterium]|nr:HAD-IIIC family phosphatase [Alphaproteobacteria bacterium]
MSRAMSMQLHADDIREQDAGPAGSDDACILASSFALDPAIEPLEFLFRQLGLDTGVQLATPGPLAIKLMDPSSDLQCASAPRVIAFRWRDVAGLDAEGGYDAGPMISALGAAGDDGVATLALACPDGDPRSTSATGILAAAFAEASAITVRDLSEVFVAYSVNAPHDAHADTLAQIPYTEEAFCAIAAAIARWRSRFARPPIKLVCVDGDNTLWDGVLGEAGVEGVSLSSGHAELQVVLKSAARDGVALALVTKNEPTDIRSLFGARPDFPLGLSDFHAVCAGWNSKADAVRRVADDLSIGPGGVLFIDDSPVECADVKAGAPGVVVIRAPDLRTTPLFAGHVWPLDRGITTDADRQRAASIADEARRRAAETAAESLDDFFRTLELVVETQEATEADAPRLEQMAARTNQFNSTLNRLTAGDFINSIRRADGFAFVTSARDRFGDYGLVGGMSGKIVGDGDASRISVDLWTLSCRAIGRGVEHQMAARLGAFATSIGAAKVSIRVVEGPRNAPFLSFLTSISTDRPAAAGQVVLSAADLAAVSFTPGETRSGDAGAHPVASASKTLYSIRSEIFETLATEWSNAGCLLDAVRGRPRARGELSRSFVAPRPGPESVIAGLWSTVLNVERVGVEDDFAELGGKSLHLVRIFEAMPEEIRRRLSLADLFRFSTVRGLAAHATGANEITNAAERGERMRTAKLAAAARGRPATGRRR